jgi:hypothetical protein
MSAFPTSGGKVQEVAAQASPWIEKFGRWGYASKGVIYGLIGVLAFIAASGDGGKVTDQKGVIDTIAQSPLGQPLLVVLGIGLFGYSLFRLASAIFNPEFKKPMTRFGYALSGLGYGFMGFLAFRAAMGVRAQSDSSHQTAQVMALPDGELLIGLIGLILIGVGASQMVSAATGSFMKTLDTARMEPQEEKVAQVMGRLGIAARAIVFMIIGGFFCYGALNSDPTKTRGIEQALSAIAKLPYGMLLLGLIGLGLVLYGGFMFVKAKWRRFAPLQPQASN